SRCGRGQEVWKTGKNGSAGTPRPTMRLAREYASVDLVRPVHKPEMRPRRAHLCFLPRCARL
ncbi:MAG: hypothetical protein IKQ55_09125, partial [Kiritimatiellae bacterium]|nr:hypothetical protein [Kiritimatiellia bacterium]